MTEKMKQNKSFRHHRVIIDVSRKGKARVVSSTLVVFACFVPSMKITPFVVSHNAHSLSTSLFLLCISIRRKGNMVIIHSVISFPLLFFASPSSPQELSCKRKQTQPHGERDGERARDNNENDASECEEPTVSFSPPSSLSIMMC